MVTRIDDFIKEFMVTLMEEDKLDGVAFQKLLNNVRESFQLDVVYTLEKISIDREFIFRFINYKTRILPLQHKIHCVSGEMNCIPA